MTHFNQHKRTTSVLPFAGFLFSIVICFLSGTDLSAQGETSVEENLRRLIPSATAMDTKLFDKLATSSSIKAADFDDHSLTFSLFATDYKTAQDSGGQFRWLTEKTPKPNLLAKEMYRSIGGGRFRIVTHPVTMIQQHRITKFEVNVEGQSASGTFEFHVPELYEGKTDFAAEQSGDKWRITQLRMPGLKIDLKSDESGQWWRTADLKDFNPPECLVGHTGTVWSLDFSKDGKLLVSGGGDHSIRIWDIARRKQLLTIPQAHVAELGSPSEGWVLGVGFGPDEQRVASSSDDGTVKIWDVSTGDLERVIEVKNIVSEVIYSPDGRTVLSSSSALEIWSAKTGELEQTIRGHSFPSTAVSPDGLMIATGGADPKREDPDDDRRTVKLWDAKSGEPLATSDNHHRALITDMEISPDGKRIASCGRDKTIRIWDAGDLDQMVKIESDQDVLQSLSWSPDGHWIVAGDIEGHVTIWNAATGDSHRNLPDHPEGIRCVAFSPDGKRIATSGHDGVIRFWDFAPESIEE